MTFLNAAINLLVIGPGSPLPITCSSNLTMGVISLCHRFVQSCVEEEERRDMKEGKKPTTLPCSAGDKGFIKLWDEFRRQNVGHHRDTFRFSDLQDNLPGDTFQHPILSSVQLIVNHSKEVLGSP